MAAGIASAPATCGELVQGTLGGRHFLVSCPIDWWIEATAEAAAGGLAVSPADRTKVRRAINHLLSAYGLPDDVRVTLRSCLPSGRGLGTSTAEIGAALDAVARLHGITLTPLEATRIAVSVEPTDSSLLPNLAILDHRTGGLVIPLPPPPAMDVLVVDPGGEVDTVAFNAIDRDARWREIESETRRALELLVDGLRRQDVECIGLAATISALAGERVVGGTLAGRLAQLVRTIGALGVVSARSGTVAGLLFRPGAATPDAIAHVADRTDGAAIRIARLIGGGVRNWSEIAVGHRQEAAFPRSGAAPTGPSSRSAR